MRRGSGTLLEVSSLPDPDEGKESTLKDSARRSLPYAALSGALQILLSLVGMLLLVRYLPPALYGQWVVLLAFGAPIMIFTSLGFRHSLLRFTPAIEGQYDRSRFLWSVLFRRLRLVLVLCVATYLAFPLFDARLGLEGQSDVLLLLTPGFFLFAVNQYLVVGLNAGFRQREVFIGSVVYQAALLLGVVLGIRLEEQLPFFAGAQLVATSFYTLFNLAAGAHYLGKPELRDLTHRHQENSEERQYRLNSFVDDIGNSLLSPDMSRFILAAFSTSPQVAVYAVATNITQRLRALTPLEVFRPLTTVIFFKRFEEVGTVGEVNRMFHLLFAVDRIVTMSFLVLFVPLGYEALVWLFRLDYGASYLPIVLLMIGLGLFKMPIGIVAQTLRRPRALVYSKLAVLLNIGLGIPLTIEYGAVGMAAATATSELAKNVIVYGLLRREFRIRYPWLSAMRFLLAGILVGGLLWWLQGTVHFMVAGVAGAAAWLLAIRAFRVINAEDAKILSEIIPARFRRTASLLLGS